MMGFSVFRKSKIKIGFLISYDYRYIFDALPIVYPYADEIILCVDVNRNTWAGGKYELDPDFFDHIRAIDPKRKIVIFEDDFYDPSLTPMENDTRERNMLSKKMGADCWKLQIDADEYFLDFQSVYHWLQQHRFLLAKPNRYPVNVRALWVTLFKKTENGYIYIDNNEDFSFATNLVGQHFFARDLASVKNYELRLNFKVLHHSWARQPQEVHQKIKNWSHKDDFDGDAFYDFWMSIDEHNYTQFKDLHPIYKGAWQELKFIACANIQEFIEKFNALHPPQPVVPIDPKFFQKFIKNQLLFWRK